MADFALNRRVTHRRRGVGGKVLGIAAAVIACAFLLELVFQLVIGPAVSVKRVVVESDLRYSHAEIVSLAGLSGNESYFGIDPAAIVSRLEAHPSVRSARLEKAFPDTVKLTVSGRRPLGMLMVQTSGGDVPAVFDEEGVVFRAGSSIETWDLPVFSGVRFEDFRVGARLPAEFSELLTELKRIQLESPALFDSISELRVQPGAGRSFDVVVYTVRYRTPVRVGSRVNEEQLRYVLVVLDLLHRQGRAAEIVELDFRTADIVYRTRGE